MLAGGPNTEALNPLRISENSEPVPQLIPNRPTRTTVHAQTVKSSNSNHAPHPQDPSRPRPGRSLRSTPNPARSRACQVCRARSNPHRISLSVLTQPMPSRPIAHPATANHPASALIPSVPSVIPHPTLPTIVHAKTVKQSNSSHRPRHHRAHAINPGPERLLAGFVPRCVESGDGGTNVGCGSALCLGHERG